MVAEHGCSCTAHTGNGIDRHGHGIKMNAYVTKTDGMMTVVETNDTALKATIEAAKGTLDTQISELQASATKTITDAAGIQQAQLQLLSSEFSTSISGMDAKLQFVNDQITKAETAWIGSEQAQEDRRAERPQWKQK